MIMRRTSVICTILFLCLLLLTSCADSLSLPATPTPGSTKPVPTPTLSAPTLTPIATLSTTAPTHYTARVLLKGVARPDDMAFDLQGHILFSDFYNGTVSHLNANGSVTVLLRGIAGPEGLVVLPNGTLIIAEQRTNRILTLAPGAPSPTVLRALPGMPSTANCKDGVDGIALDPVTNTIIVPDSPTGKVYRMSLDGKSLTLLASGIVRPVGAAVDAQGNIYVADECGGALWRIPPQGAPTRMGGFGMLDDVAFDSHGNILVTDLAGAIHALIRVNWTTGKRETLASRGFIEPQVLLVDSHDDIFVSDDYEDIIVEYIPA
jgi:glucose/arabinose dehydrogenase